MIVARFDSPTVVTSNNELHARFGGDAANLAPGACVTFDGEISIAAGVEFAGTCQFSDGTQIGAGAVLTGFTMGRRNVVRPYSIISDATAGNGNLFGPFCFIRDGCVIGDDCILGAHVEAVRSRFATGVKVSHRAFIGDATIGNGTIIGAGVVFCNFDGTGRQSTVIDSFVTIGSGTLLIPPLTIGERATIGAGSTVTKSVPAMTKLIQKRSNV